MAITASKGEDDGPVLAADEEGSVRSVADGEERRSVAEGVVEEVEVEDWICEAA